jgi:hypothetical protein
MQPETAPLVFVRQYSLFRILRSYIGWLSRWVTVVRKPSCLHDLHHIASAMQCVAISRCLQPVSLFNVPTTMQSSTSFGCLVSGQMAFGGVSVTTTKPLNSLRIPVQNKHSDPFQRRTQQHRQIMTTCQEITWSSSRKTVHLLEIGWSSVHRSIPLIKWKQLLTHALAYIVDAR